MKKLLKWMGILVSPMLMVVLAVLILTPLANKRQEAFAPLSEETLRAVLLEAGIPSAFAETRLQSVGEAPHE